MNSKKKIALRIHFEDCRRRESVIRVKGKCDKLTRAVQRNLHSESLEESAKRTIDGPNSQRFGTHLRQQTANRVAFPSNPTVVWAKLFVFLATNGGLIGFVLRGRNIETHFT